VREQKRTEEAMLTLAQEVFSMVCGQNQDHTWMAGDILLPCCQRCTGLYAGALLGIALHLWLKPALTGSFLKWHGFALLFMVPFGFHWLPQGAWLRTVTGVLFGAGVVTFLWLPLAAIRNEHPIGRAAPAYWLLLVAGVLLLPWCGATGWRPCGFFLTALVCAGALALAVLVAVNALLVFRELLHLRTRKRV
jgi:uncharacterized membrane protein